MNLRGAAPKNPDFAPETVAKATFLGFGPNILDFSTFSPVQDPNKSQKVWSVTVMVRTFSR
jgi:hypothetical protein